MLKKFNKLILLIILFCFLAFSIFLYQCCLWQFFVKDGQLVQLVLKDKYFSTQGKELLVEIVKNESSTQRGLSNRAQLQTVDGQQLDGMLFIFPEARIRQFWMKDMQFDIDICWLKDHYLLDCARRAAKPDLDSQEDLAIYQSSQRVDLVLETMPDFLTEDFIGSRFYLKFF